MINKIKLFTLIAIFISMFTGYAQDSLVYEKGKKYELGGITVKGLQKFTESTVKVYTGLRSGQIVKIPGDKLTSAIKKLHETGQFSKVDVYLTKVVGEVAYLEFEVTELPQIGTITINGISKSQSKDILEETELKKGEMLNENVITTTKNYITKKYAEKGFLNTKVSLDTKLDTSDINTVDMLINIDKGGRVKINEINIEGNRDFSDKKVRKAMKNTKRKFFGRFWKKSKYIDEDFKSDLKNVIDTYNEKGYRDARILDHSFTKKDDKTVDVTIALEEGKQYRFRDITYIGNTVYTDAQLDKFLQIDKGDIYNSKVLKERVVGDGSPDSYDIASSYSNKGYLLAQVNPVEVKVENDSIDVEIRIFEGDPFTLRRVTINGNTQTNDHVAYRELRTRPGQLFSKEEIIRSIRELGQLGFFDPESITPDVVPDYAAKTADINYSVQKRGASQVELQGGYGGGSFIGTLGLSFNNFSIRNLFNKEAYKPLPMGDGQKLALRLQTSRFYSTYSFSFTEPWLGGKKPQSLSFSIYNSRQFGFGSSTRDVDKDQRLNILGVTIGLGKRLRWPDDYFSLSQSISYQNYDLKNYNLSVFNGVSNGTSNNLAYTINFGRNSSGPNPIFPVSGSNFNIGLKMTPPYSLFNNKDYSNLSQEESIEWIEYYKMKFKGQWYSALGNIGKTNKLVLMTDAEFGFLGQYDNKVGITPFERFYVGGDGLQNGQIDGREVIRLRGYDNQSLSDASGGTIYNRVTFELRAPITLKPSASIYALGFVEAGNSYDAFENYSPFELKRSAGLGLRVFMPAFGLLGIDFAHGFDEVIPGAGTSGWKTHFIIGQQF